MTIICETIVFNTSYQVYVVIYDGCDLFFIVLYNNWTPIYVITALFCKHSNRPLNMAEKVN